LAEKERLRAEAGRWTGQRPRTWPRDASRALKPTRSRTSARETSARTSAKRMPGMAVTCGGGTRGAWGRGRTVTSGPEQRRGTRIGRRTPGGRAAPAGATLGRAGARRAVGSNDNALLPAHAGKTLGYSNPHSRGRSAAARLFA